MIFYYLIEYLSNMIITFLENHMNVVSITSHRERYSNLHHENVNRIDGRCENNNNKCIYIYTTVILHQPVNIVNPTSYK
jgi:hypothetical protein